MANGNSPHISVTIPVYNEEESITQLIDEIEAALKDIDYEIIFVDDGSTDESLRILKGSREKNARIKIIQFSDNYGQQAAFTAAYQAAKGDIIVTMDADLQNDPADIPKFVEKIDREGNSAAFGWRINRENDLLMRRIPSKLFNLLRNSLLRRPLHDYGCALNAFKREFVDELSDRPMFMKHITTHIARKRVPFVEVQIRERERFAGKSRYDLMRLLQLSLDLLVTASPKPIATTILLLTTGFSFLLFLISTLVILPSVLFDDGYALTDMIYPFIFFVSAAVCGALALINEKLYFLLHQAYGKPLHIVKEYLD